MDKAIYPPNHREYRLSSNTNTRLRQRL